MKSAFLLPLLVAVAAAGAVSASLAQSQSVPLTLGSWETGAYDNYFNMVPGTPSLTETASGIRMDMLARGSGSAYNYLFTSAPMDISEGDVYLKWRCSGAGQYMYMILALGQFDPGTASYETHARSGTLSTSHAYSGSTIVSSNTWYYSHFVLDPAGETYACTVALSDYADNGGTVVDTYTAGYPETRSGPLASGQVGFRANDNWGGTSCWVEIGEAVVNPVPEPAVMALHMALVAGALAWLRRRG